MSRHLRRKRLAAALPLLAAAAGGCAGVQPRQSFPAVATDVADRSAYRLHWNDGTAADRAVAGGVTALLGRPLDADAAVQIALLNNRHLQATYESLGIAQADLVAAGLLKNPVFSGDYRFVEAGASGTIDLNITFDFLDVLFIGLRKHVAAAQLEVAKADVTAAVLDLAGDVKTAVYAQQAAEQSVALRRQIDQTAAAGADLAQRLFDAGNTTPLERARAQAAQAETALALRRAEADAAAGRERLNTLLGLWGGQVEWTLTGPLPEPAAVEIDAPAAENQAVAASLDLRRSRARIAVLLAELGVAQPLGALSELETGVSSEKQDGRWEVGPSLTLPIPLFSQGQPIAAKYAARVRAAEAEDYATAIDVRSAARAAAVRVASLRQQIDAAKTELLPLRQTVVEQTQLQYNALQVGGFALFEAKRQQVEAAEERLSLLREYWIAKSRLQGILSGHVSGLANESLSPAGTMNGPQINTDEHG